MSDTGHAPLLTLCGTEDAAPPGQARLDEAAASFRAAFETLGLDMDDPNLDGTERRVVRSYHELFAGLYAGRPPDLRTFPNPERYGQMVAVTDIPFHSLCAHHLLPFFGKCHIAYMPSRKIVGLSKLPRLVEMFARRLQVQERLTTQIAQTLNDVLQPRGVAVVIEALHMCMLMRGVEKQNSKAVTSAMLGAFRDNAGTRAEFMELIRPRLGMMV